MRAESDIQREQWTTAVLPSAEINVGRAVTFDDEAHREKDRSLRVGIAPSTGMKARTLAIARGERRSGPNEPRLWFTSVESFARVLSERNRALLALVVEAKPRSLAELAALSGRAKSNLSRTLRTMERHGLVTLEPGPDRTLRPRVPYQTITLDLPLRHAA